MITEPITLYKLMILYLLKTVNYPLSNNQLSGFFLDYEYTTYFTLQEAISQLTEAKLITPHKTKNTTRYEVTKEGSETLNLFWPGYPGGGCRGYGAFSQAEQAPSPSGIFQLRGLQSGREREFYRTCRGSGGKRHPICAGYQCSG